MRKTTIIIIGCCLFFSQNKIYAQTFTDSNLPIVLITTANGATIPNEPKIGGDLKIIFRGISQRNYLTDEINPSFLNYNGRIGIKVRGNSSADNPQKPYGFETRLADNSTANNVSLLGMPSENDWILLATFQDKSLIRDYLAYDMARSIGMYASRGKYVEVLLNGEYIGIYILEEKLKRDKNRVDITELLISEETAPEITGGYLLQEDDGGVITNPHLDNTANNLLIVEEPKIATQSMINYLQNFFNNLEVITGQPNLANLQNGYPSLIDTYSAYNYFIINEYFNNTDAYSRSTFYHKDRNGKLIFGPVWDFNLSAGNNNQFGSTNPDHWEVKTGFYQGPIFLAKIFDEPNFRCNLAKRWHELRLTTGPLNTIRINTKIDSVANSLVEAQERHFTKWPILGFCTAIDPPGCDTRLTFQSEVEYFKQFLAAKATWIDDNIILGYPNCINPILPNLVINEIMYNPFFVQTNSVPSFRAVENQQKSANHKSLAASADDFEFIEIKNNELTSVDLSGIYFRGGGIVYQFPANSTIGAGAIIVIASNAVEFEIRYGFAPFGQFTRDLSNTGENIILADGMGNEIDNVQYSNQAQWPNIYGKSIELKGSNLNNTLPENWFQQTVNGGSPGAENVYVAPDPCLVLPNIIINEINYRSTPSTISDWIEIYNSGNTTVNLSGWQIKDSGTTPLVLAANTTMAPNSYLVFVEKLPPSTIAFTSTYPTVTNFYQIAFTYGLSSAGEQVTLIDANGCIIDQITYGVINPWPTSPNGQGYSLSLKQPNLDNSLGSNWAGSNGLLGTPGTQNFAEIALPVTLISFKITDNIENHAQLKWLTTNENNLEKFEVQKSIDAKIFNSIGFVKANGEGNYEYLDNSSFEKLNYYRLKMVDFGGKFKYSAIEALNKKEDEIVKIFPNPANDFIEIEYQSANFSLNFVDITGKNIFGKTEVKNKIKVSTKDWQTGTYFLKITAFEGKNIFTKKVIIAR